MERREAQRPTSLAAHSEAAIPGNGDIAVSALAGREVRPAGLDSLLLKGGAPPPWRLPALHPLMGKKEKGKDGRRTSLNNRRAERWLSRDPEKWKPVSRLREALAWFTILACCFGGRTQVGKDHAQRIRHRFFSGAANLENSFTTRS